MKSPGIAFVLCTFIALFCCFVMFANGYKIMKYFSVKNNLHKMKSLVLPIDSYTYSKAGRLASSGEYLIVANHNQQTFKIPSVHNSEFIEKMMVWNLSVFVWDNGNAYFKRKNGSLTFDIDNYLYDSAFKKNLVYFSISTLLLLWSLRRMFLILMSEVSKQ